MKLHDDDPNRIADADPPTVSAFAVSTANGTLLILTQKKPLGQTAG